MNNPVGDVPWEDVKAASPWLSQPAIWHVMRTHVIFQSAATGMAVLAVVVWLGCTDLGRKSMHWPVLVLLLGSVGIIVAGAWNGGELIYHHGVSVQTGAAAEIGEPSKYPFMRFIPPRMELHVVGAGAAVAIALAAIGLSCRKLTSRYDNTDPSHQTVMENSTRNAADAMVMIRSFNPGVEVNVDPCAPATRFWLLAFGLAAVTAVLGVIVLAEGSDALVTAKKSHEAVWKVLWGLIKPRDGEKINRAARAHGDGVGDCCGAGDSGGGWRSLRRDENFSLDSSR